MFPLKNWCLILFYFFPTMLCLIFWSGAVVNADLAEGLILYLSFEEDKGEEEVIDRSENEHNGVLQGVPLPEQVPGYREKALSFEPGGWVEVPHSDSLDLTDAGTVAAWVNIRPSSPTIWRAVVSKANTGQDAMMNYTLDVRENAPRFYFGDGAASLSAYNESAKISFDTWHFIAGTFDGEKVKLFVDGEFTVEVAQTIEPRPNAEIFTVGAYSGGAGNSPNGMIDEVAVYNRALSEDELKKLMEEGLKGILAVRHPGKLTTTWGHVKAQEGC